MPDIRISEALELFDDYERVSPKGYVVPEPYVMISKAIKDYLKTILEMPDHPKFKTSPKEGGRKE